ncbi:peroxisomal membrane protein 11C isoform X4 [Pipistrellus kuhlii]|uniref:peroxisomal membrane protein 11C isoform X4 n=1 Tax=Pipistrellus kuhlii TaxID=59472 RepID=UPI001E272C1A|nr:peroxisomal membrane protein 11C isoform X4 [Pipistrellus kuhlii]
MAALSGLASALESYRGRDRLEEDILVRCVSVLGNLADQLYYPCEHIAWAADARILHVDSARWWALSTALWGLSLLLGIARCSRYTFVSVWKAKEPQVEDSGHPQTGGTQRSRLYPMPPLPFDLALCGHLVLALISSLQAGLCLDLSSPHVHGHCLGPCRGPGWALDTPEAAAPGACDSGAGTYHSCVGAASMLFILKNRLQFRAVLGSQQN